MNRIKLESGTTISDVYARFCDAIQGGNPDDAIRSERELQRVIHGANLRYEECDRLSVSSDWAYKFSDEPDARVSGP